MSSTMWVPIWRVLALSRVNKTRGGLNDGRRRTGLRPYDGYTEGEDMARLLGRRKAKAGRVFSRVLNLRTWSKSELG